MLVPRANFDEQVFGEGVRNGPRTSRNTYNRIMLDGTRSSPCHRCPAEANYRSRLPMTPLENVVLCEPRHTLPINRLTRWA